MDTNGTTFNPRYLTLIFNIIPTTSLLFSKKESQRSFVENFTLLIGTTVFRGMRKFESSRGICPFPQNFYVFTQFCGIRYSTVIRGQIRHILIEFGPPYCMYTWFHHEIHDCHSGFDGRNTENIKLSLSEILPVNLVDRLYLSVAVTGDKYCVFGRVQRAQNRPQNLANWPAEFRKICHGKLWSLIINKKIYTCYTVIRTEALTIELMIITM